MPTDPSPTPDRRETSDSKQGLGSRIAVVAVGSALFMQFIDSTALTTALPTLARNFHSDPANLRSVLTTYIVVQALFLPASGWLADRFGARKVFTAAMGVFLVGSILCGLSHSLGQLIAARVVQGMGGAMMIPVGRIIVISSSPRTALIQAMMWMSIPAMVGPVLGPPLAGLILELADWPWIFFINVPVGLLGILAVVRFVPRITQPHPGGFDLIGFLLSTVFIAAIMTLAETVDLQPSPLALQAGAAVLAVASAAGYVRYARARVGRGLRPVLDLSMLRYPTFRSSVTGGSLVRLGIGGTPYLIQFLLQVGLHWSPVRASVVTIFTAVGSLCARPWGPKLIRNLGFRQVLIGSSLVLAVIGALPGFFTASTPMIAIALVLGLTGFIRAGQFSAVSALAYAEIPEAATSAASTLSSVLQQISLSLGITLAGLLLHLAQGGAHALTPGMFLLPFLAISVLGLASAPIYARLPDSAGWEISGRRKGRR